MATDACGYCGELMGTAHKDWCPDKPKPGVLMWQKSAIICNGDSHAFVWTSSSTDDGGMPDGLRCQCGQTQHVRDTGRFAPAAPQPAAPDGGQWAAGESGIREAWRICHKGWRKAGFPFWRSYMRQTAYEYATLRGWNMLYTRAAVMRR